MISYFWPQYIVWETTLRCNLRCIHCGSTAGHDREQELSTEECVDLIHQLQELGCPTIVLSGGETLLRHDWETLVQTILDGGGNTGIITNGITIHNNPGIAPRLRQLSEASGRHGSGLYVGISIDGMEKNHDLIRGIEGGWRRAWQAVERLGQENVPTAVMTSVNKINLDDLEELKEIVYHSPSYAWQFQVVTPYGRMKERREFILDRLDYARLVKFIARERMNCPTVTPQTTDNIGYYTALEPVLRDCPWQGCNAGIRSLGILSNGDIKGCLSLLDDCFIEGNIREQSLQEIWDKPGGFAYNRDFHEGLLEGPCKGCSYGATCRAGCTSTAHAYTHSPYQNPLCLYGIEQDGLLEPATFEELQQEINQLQQQLQPGGITYEALIAPPQAQP